MSQSQSANPNSIGAASSTATSPSPAHYVSKTSSRKREEPIVTTPKSLQVAVQRSWVWDHVTRFTIKETQEIIKEGKKEEIVVEVTKVKCNYCDQLFVFYPTGGSISTYGKHILRYRKKYKPTDDIRQTVLCVSDTSGTSSDFKGMIVARGWSQEESVVGIVEFIVLDEMPFSVVEKEGFKRMMRKVQPRLHVPSRRTIVREFFKMYDEMKTGLRIELAKHRVSLTTDKWTSVQNVNYMVLTAHFVDDEWNMHKRILNFCPIPSHTGKEIGKLIEHCLVQWEIEKVMCVSVDNASANKVAVQWLVGKMMKWPNSQLILTISAVDCC